MDGLETTFTFNDPVSSVVSEWDRKDAHHHPEFRKLFVNAMEEADGGELVVALPEGYRIRAASAEAFLPNGPL